MKSATSARLIVGCRVASHAMASAGRSSLTATAENPHQVRRVADRRTHAAEVVGNLVC
jgi:hypothetical protein